MPGLLARIAGIMPGRLRTRRFDAAASDGRRWGSRPSFGPVSLEALAAAGPVRSRARYAFNNNGWIANAVGAWVPALVGPGIMANPAHPAPATRRLHDIDAALAGTTIDEVVAATGWQAHTVRGAMAGALKKKLGLQAAINRFVEETNADPKPFVWTANPDRVLAAVRRGQQALESIH